MRVCGVYFVFVILLSACTNGVSHLDKIGRAHV